MHTTQNKIHLKESAGLIDQEPVTVLLGVCVKTLSHEFQEKVFEILGGMY